MKIVTVFAWDMNEEKSSEFDRPYFLCFKEIINMPDYNEMLTPFLETP